MAVFPRYDMAEQYTLLRAVSERSEVPVPRLHWLVPDVSVLGSPFFVMDRAVGLVPPDNLPYALDGWLLQATPRSANACRTAPSTSWRGFTPLPSPRCTAPDSPADPATALRQHVDAQRACYQWALVTDGIRIPLVERTFAWLEQHCNMMYVDFAPVAVLDWEMAALGPRELDLGWFIFFHRFYQELAPLAGVAGLPDFLRREDVVRAYEQRSSTTVTDLDFCLVYAALRHAIIMARIKRRMVHFGPGIERDDHARPLTNCPSTRPRFPWPGWPAATATSTTVPTSTPTTPTAAPSWSADSGCIPTSA